MMDKTIKIMTFNILFGGNKKSLYEDKWTQSAEERDETFNQTVEVIKQSQADIVGLQEAETHTSDIAKMLGWFSNPRTMTISRFPLIDPPFGDSIYVFVEVQPGKVIAVANCHPDDKLYGPNLVRDGHNINEIIKNEKTIRTSVIQNIIEKLKSINKMNIPIFITGDFNSPSHLDWTQEVIDQSYLYYSSEKRYPIKWPTTVALEKAGYIDSYRKIHPNPILHPGLTWMVKYPNIAYDETYDRIDFIFVDNKTKILNSRIIGEQKQKDIDIVIAPWPSDHRAIITTVKLIPQTPPVFITPLRRKITTHKKLLPIYCSIDEPASVLVIKNMKYSSDIVYKTNINHTGYLNIPIDKLKPNTYDLRLISDKSNKILSTATFWLYGKGQSIVLLSQKQIYKVGDPITISWKAAPGYKFDWIGVFKENDRKPLLYHYTQTQIEGIITFDKTLDYWPLEKGKYDIKYLFDNTNKSGAKITIKIK